jgi:glycosyltransferase involved in cell wall biosynthesis
LAARYSLRVTIAADTDRSLVSCLMVTLPAKQRLSYFRRSVADYCRQTHPARELVVVVDRGDPEARAEAIEHIASLRRDDIRVVEPADKLTLGALRNVSIAEARGDALCVWDDDDMHHPARVATQLREMTRAGARALVLEEALQYFPATRTLLWTRWREIASRGLPGTLMFRRSEVVRYPEAGPDAARSEDMAGIAQLQSAGAFCPMAGAPHLYVYVSHGANTWDDDHHAKIARDLAIPQARLWRNEALMRRGIAPFDFGPGDLTVKGRDGVAFVIAGTPDREQGSG